MNTSYRVVSSGQTETPTESPASTPVVVGPGPSFNNPSVPGWYLARSFDQRDAMSAMTAFPANEMERVLETPEAIVARAQQAINAFVDDRQLNDAVVRNDGTLDSDTLSSAARVLASLPDDEAAVDPVVSNVVSAVQQALTNASQTRRLEGIEGIRAWSGIIALSLPGVIRGSRQSVGSWLMRGGVRLGTEAQLATVRLPRVEAPSELQRALPGTMNFIREYKYPLAVGGIAIVGFIAYYLYNRDNE